MTWLEDPPPWLKPCSSLPSPAYCFASVIVWTENKNVTIYDRFICFILTVKWRWRPVFWGRQLKRSSTLFEEKVHPGDLAGGFSDLKVTWLLYCAGAATVLVGISPNLYLTCSWGQRWTSSKALRYGTRSQGISQFYLHTPLSYANGMNHTCLCISSQSWYSFTDPGGMEGWVGYVNSHVAVL